MQPIIETQVTPLQAALQELKRRHTRAIIARAARIDVKTLDRMANGQTGIGTDVLQTLCNSPLLPDADRWLVATAAGITIRPAETMDDLDVNRDGRVDAADLAIATAEIVTASATVNQQTAEAIVDGQVDEGELARITSHHGRLQALNHRRTSIAHHLANRQPTRRRCRPLPQVAHV